ncbi:MAG TPA: PPC domain-containing DNA-binding protein [Blastocatellia bacterium]|nr:PPC domain-containing DNA-binding protein [Blastocatellia bacterium]
MKVKRTEDGFLLVLDIGDEIIASLKELASTERIGLASIAGIGAVHKAVLGYLDVEQKQYLKRQYGPESVELLSLTGNMSRLKGEPLPHCHVVLGDREMRTFGGHLFEAYVSVTVEIFVRVFEGEVSRRFEPACGANLLNI